METLSVPAMEPLGRALLEHLETGTPVDVRVRRDDGQEYRLSTRDFFEVPGDLAHLAASARSRVRGRVLDVGAGAGRSALELQADGLEVWALDACPLCVEVMRRRGVERAIRADVFDFEEGPFDTIVLLMDTVGLAGSPDGLRRLLGHLRRRLAPGGRIVLDGSALEAAESGAVQLQLRHRHWVGAVVPWLYLGPDDLVEQAAGVGLRADIVETLPEAHHWLAVLEVA